MKKLFLIMFLSCLTLKLKTITVTYGANYNDLSYWHTQPAQPVFNYQFNTTPLHGNTCVNYDNIVAREFGRSIGNLIVAIQHNKG